MSTTSRCQHTPKGSTMNIETAVLSALVFGGAALVMIISFILARCADEARHMIHDDRQHHYGGETE